MRKLADGAPYNRSFRLTPAAPVGGALLVHGLTDSPYSVRAVAEVLYRSGFEVTVLRLPGHGTLPSMMTEMHARDWQAAVELAARDVAARTPPGAPVLRRRLLDRRLAGAPPHAANAEDDSARGDRRACCCSRRRSS